MNRFLQVLTNLGIGDPINTFNFIYGLYKTNNLPKNLNDIHKIKVPEILYFEIQQTVNKKVVEYIINQIKENEYMSPSYIFEISERHSTLQKNCSFYTPHYIVDFIFNKIKPSNNIKICDPFAGSGAFTLGYIKYCKDQLPNLKNVIHIDLNPDVYKPVKLEMYILTNQIENNVLTLNSLNEELGEYDYIFTNPPFGNIEFEISIIKKLKQCLKPDGLCIAILKDGFIFNTLYQNIRNEINILNVISLPSDIYENTKVKTSIIIFDKKENKNQTKYTSLIIEKFKDDVFDEDKNKDIFLKNSKGDIKQIKEEAKLYYKCAT